MKGTVDHYNGIIIDPKSLPSDANNFKQDLIRIEIIYSILTHKESLSKWKSEKRKGVWLNIPIELSHLISIAVEVEVFELLKT